MSAVSAAVAHACRILPKYWTRAAAMFTLLFILLQADRMVLSTPPRSLFERPNPDTAPSLPAVLRSREPTREGLDSGESRTGASRASVGGEGGVSLGDLC